MLRVMANDTERNPNKTWQPIGCQKDGSPALTIAPEDLIIVFGYGNGLLVRMLSDQEPRARLLVFEPDPGVTSTPAAATAEPLGDRLTLVRDREVLEDLLNREIVRGPQAATHVLTTSQYCLTFPGQLDEFQDMVRGARLRRAVIDKTSREKGHLFLANLAENVPYLLGSPLLTSLKGVCSGLPGFLVGSGPSLEHNGACLQQAQGRGVILAAGSAVKPLQELGVNPDIIVIIEAEDTSDYLTGLERTPGTILALASEVHPNHFRITGYQSAAFHLTSCTAYLFESDDFVPQAGTAGSTAFTLGLLLGLNPLVLLGQDQAFQGGRMHASGTPGDLPLDKDNTAFAVFNSQGLRLPTHSAFAAALHWYAESARYLARQEPKRIIINASEKGAAIPGIPDLSLQDALRLYLPADLRPPNLVERLLTAPRPNPEALRRQARQACTVLGSLSLLMSFAPAQGLEMVNDCRKNHPFLRGPLAGLSEKAPVEEITANIRRIENSMLKILDVLE